MAGGFQIWQEAVLHVWRRRGRVRARRSARGEEKREDEGGGRGQRRRERARRRRQGGQWRRGRAQ
eukprot:802427-Prymnesium_polylepis.1